jgi:aldose 1-epimerase
MKISKKTFGVLSSGKKVSLFTLKAGDLSLSISTFGATLTSLWVPSKSSGKADLFLGFPTLEGWAATPRPYMGATIGRFANRVGGASFTLDGKTYPLYKNDGPHSLHGGRRGFDASVWKADAYEERDKVLVRLEMESPAGDEGYPGNLKAVVTYGLSKANELVADYEAQVDAPCPVNLTNHAYFNLAGEGEGDILSHDVLLHCSSYLEVDKNLIPTGRLIPVKGGPFDFLKAKPIGRDIAAAGGGYDHCFVVDGKPGKLRPCAEVFEGKTGRTMRVFSTQPGVQFYTGNFLKGAAGKTGSLYHKHSGFCLETQHFPDSPNQPDFPSCVFGPGRDYHEKALFAFDW